MVRTDNDRNTFTPDANVAKNMWFWKDVPGMEKASGLHFDGVPIDVVGMDVPGGYPKSSDGTILVRNDHLGYAITWFTLAFAAALIFVLTHFKPDTEQ